MGIYVETLIRAPLERVWQHTQDPSEHQRWDLRFSWIQYLPKTSAQQQFLYGTRLGFGLNIEGKGESLGTLEKDGSRTSALRFWSDDSKSLIHEGSGYWKYSDAADGTRFCTDYDYRTRFGSCGSLLDRLAFRPLIGWATAWSFDCLRLWLEKGISPELSLTRATVHAISRATLAFIWIYQGLVPKLFFRNLGELQNVQALALPDPHVIVTVAGLLEIAFGLALLVFWRSRALLAIQIPILVGLLLTSAATPWILATPFNAATLTIGMVALCATALVVGKDLPTARACRRTR